MWVAGCLKKSFLFSPIRNTAACNLHQIFLIPERSACKLLLVGWMWGVHIAHARLLGGRVALGQACPSHHLLCLHSWSTDKPMQIPYEWKCLLEGKGLRLWPFPFCGSIVLEPFWRTKRALTKLSSRKGHQGPRVYISRREGGLDSEQGSSPLSRGVVLTHTGGGGGQTPAGPNFPLLTGLPWEGQLG